MQGEELCRNHVTLVAGSQISDPCSSSQMPLESVTLGAPRAGSSDTCYPGDLAFPLIFLGMERGTLEFLRNTGLFLAAIDSPETRPLLKFRGGRQSRARLVTLSLRSEFSENFKSLRGDGKTESGHRRCLLASSSWVAEGAGGKELAPDIAPASDRCSGIPVGGRHRGCCVR